MAQVGAWKDPPALGDLRLAESVRSELLEERRMLDGPGAFFSWLGSVLGLLCLGGCHQDLIGLKRPISDDLFSYRDFF